MSAPQFENSISIVAEEVIENNDTNENLLCDYCDFIGNFVTLTAKQNPK